MNKIFFIVGMGRSGTVLLSKLLERSDQLTVLHEPAEMVKLDRKSYLDMHYSKGYSLTYLEKREKFVKSKLRGDRTYVEVNGYLRLHIPLLKQTFSDALIIQIVRNPKHVIRSMVSKKKSILNEIQRACGKIKFQMCCNMWAEENSKIRRHSNHYIRMEDFVSSHQGYVEGILNSLGVSQPEEEWRSVVSTKVNDTKDFIIPEYHLWQKKMKRHFKLTCGEEAAHYGYKI